MYAMSSPDASPRVSVVIPVYCASQEHRTYLAEALRSAAAQTYRDFEVVVVDDCSPIDPSAIVEDTDCLPQIGYIAHERNLGHAESRNTGVRAARGELIALLDHDDVWLPEKLELQVEALDSKPEAAMVFCDVEITDPARAHIYVDQRTIPPSPELPWFVSRPNCVITVSSVLVKKQALVDIGLFDSRYSTCDDFDAWIKILSRAPIIHLPRTLAKYRLHSRNANYAVDSLNDNKLLTALLLKVWSSAPLRLKFALLPAIARKLAGRVYFGVKSRRGGSRAGTSRTEG